MAISDITKLVGDVAKILQSQKEPAKQTPTSNIPTLSYTPTASQYNSDIVSQQNMISGIDNAIANAGASYQNIANMYDPSAQNAALQQAMGATAKEINSLYDNSARDYYRLYKTQQKALPENLSRAGVTGGASESSQLKLMNAYSDNLYRNESARDNALAGNTADYQNQIAQNSMKAANQLASYYQSYQNQLNSLNMQKAEAQAGLQGLLAQQQAAAELDKWNASIVDRVNKQLGREGGDTLWTYTTPDGKLHWTTYDDNAKALSSLYDLNKISSVTKKASGTSGGGSGGGSNPSGGGTGSANKIAADQLSRMVSVASTPTDYLTVIRNIEGAVDRGLISEQQANALDDVLSSRPITSNVAQQILAGMK